LEGFETILVLLLASTALAVLARRINLPVPIVMVVGGIGVALIPRLHLVELDPDLAFAIFVPPLLFRAALTTSLRGIRERLRPVISLAVGLVIATTLTVGVVAHYTLRELPWSSAFVLATIVAPPDAVVALALAHALKLPRRTVTILEGETLLNDTTAFVLYRLAVRAATTGEFDWKMLVPHFLLVGAGGVVVGYVVYQIIRVAQRWLSDPVLENVILLLAPFAAYIPAEALGASGVLAVVVSGLLIRRASPLVTSARTRMQSNDVYEIVEFVLNSLIFVLIGMQLGHIFRDPDKPPLLEMARATGIVAGTVMLTRIVWSYPSAYLPFLIPSVRKKERVPPFHSVTVIAWTGMRGGDSLVTALALPVVTVAGAPLAGRDLIIATTFGVILATLLVQGLTMVPLIRVLRIPKDKSHGAEEALARRHMIATGDAHLQAVAKKGDVPKHVVERVRRRHIERSEQEIDLKVDPQDKPRAVVQREVERGLIVVKRRAVVGLRADGVIDDEVLRHIERELDLEELRLEDGEDEV
jgi:CPA1 family monovalent cation:H+ antiporter